MLRTVEQNWPHRLLVVVGWLALALVVAAISFISARFVAGSMKMALLGLAGVTGIVLLQVMIPRPRLGPYLVFGLMPFTGWAFKQSPGSGFNFLTDALVLVSFCSVVLNRKERPLPQLLGVPLIFLLVLGLVQTLNPNGGGTYVTALYAIRENLLPILLFFIGLYAFRTSKQMERFVSFLMLIALVNGVWAIKQVVLGLDSGEQRWAGPTSRPTFYRDGELRAFSTFDAPWGYSYYTDLVIALGICLFFATRSWATRLLTVAALAASAAGLYLSMVRTALAMVPMIVLLIFLLRFRHPLRPAATIAIVAGCLGILWVMLNTSSSLSGPNPSQLGRIVSELNILQDKSMQDRFENWSFQGLPAALAYPFGKGLGTTGGVGATYNPSGSVATDNTFLTVAIEFGWPGLALYIFFLFAALGLGLRWYSRARERTSSWLLTACVSVIVITLLSDLINAYSSGAAGTYMFLLMGVMAFLGTSGDAERPARPAS